MKILVVNPGSTSIKFSLFDFAPEAASTEPPRTLASGKIERIGASSAASPFKFILGEGASRRVIEGERPAPNYRAGLECILEALSAPPNPPLANLASLDAVGFKAVHAGALGRGPGATLLTPDVLDAMERYSLLAPAHNPPYLAVIRAFQEAAPRTPLGALFEPAFHVTIPEERVTYGLPLEWRDRWGIQRYGFHGASHRYIAERIPQLLGLNGKDAADLRLISCHLGGSSSLCAIRGGRSVDTTFGFSPQSGLLHSTRCEDMDPFVLLFAMKELGLSAEDLGRILVRDSGLAGISGGASDFRDLWKQAEAPDADAARRARLALEVFFYQVRRQIAAMAAALEGADVICFTGGIGENGAREREAICSRLGWLGVRLDASANAAARAIEQRISAPDSPVQVWTCPTNEEWIVAREVGRLIHRGACA